MATDVVIVGGGPSGLVLGLSLARYKIKSVILEKEKDITSDPRGVVLTGDALRSLWPLGLGAHISSIGQEYYLRQLVNSSEYCSLRPGCEVIGRTEHPNGLTVSYLPPNSKETQQITASYLVGADGKRGIVRKHFLELSAGIRQEPGIFEYEGTWIAANLKITPPTPETHPNFPLWDAGYDAESVYDLFWPPNWHFCRPPGRPIACGRFGVAADRLWRHEFAVPDWDDSMDAGVLFWEHLVPIITRGVRSRRRGGELVQVTFPRDCIEVLRCRAFKFSHRVVNRWFAKRTILIGDAAHVFPPFGGQGVACGVQDAVGLAWRLAILTTTSTTATSTQEEALLQSWATRITRQNGAVQLILLKLGMALASLVGQSVPHELANPQGYRGCVDGTFLADYGGGIKLAQIYMQARLPDCQGARIGLSDQFLRGVPTIFTLLVVVSKQGWSSGTENDLVSLLQGLRQSGVHPSLLSDESVVLFDPSSNSADMEFTPSTAGCRWPVCRTASAGLLAGYPMRPGYSTQQFMRRLNNFHSNPRYVLVRPDSIVYAMASDLLGLKECLNTLGKTLCRLE
ncbi:putative monooxygenase [Aspergillus lucknowensis]|uniref:FAD-binding domain-containing protein n=1 Tax=Aspergillus lucknowensis TaxID=176173 RepID=A0ABR4LPQ5_9EURO